MGLTFFYQHLPAVVRVTSPQLSFTQLENSAARIMLPIHAVHVYHKIRYHSKNCSPQSESSEPGATVDSIHARPKRRDGLVKCMGQGTREGSRCHAPNRFGTVNMEDNVNIK